MMSIEDIYDVMVVLSAPVLIFNLKLMYLPLIIPRGVPYLIPYTLTKMYHSSSVIIS